MPRKPVADSYYTLNQAAEVLGVERHTIWRWIAAGKLASEKVGGTVLIEKSLIDHQGILPRRKALHDTGNGQHSAAP